ncbi:uncharacterized protein LOC117211625 [Bombus bifarius]|uniref:Uncharacterized protein LOC117211625 n=1 Tax=Bombus bifarius TaxID=103933 RepID=A0A6P8NAN6_9HYME|nr:uncharacterized protein LOC117211625 [Bombus bifarius]
MSPDIILSTAVINIKDQTGKPQRCRVLLDSCSQAHFLTTNACKRLGLTTKRVNIPLCGANHMTSHINRTTRTKVHSRISDYTADLTFLLVDNVIQAMPSENIDRNRLELPDKIPLAYPQFHRAAEVDSLIGAQLFWDFLCEGRVDQADKNMQLRNTALG